MRILGVLFLFVVFVLGVMFAVLNSSSVVFDYYLGRHEISLATLTALAFVLGLLSATAVSVLVLIPCKAQSRRLKHQLSVAKDELHNLRNRSILQDR